MAPWPEFPFSACLPPRQLLSPSCGLVAQHPQAFLQEFAWTEASQPARRAARSASLKRTTGQAEGIDKEPMWCFEVRGGGTLLVTGAPDVIILYKHTPVTMCGW